MLYKKNENFKKNLSFENLKKYISISKIIKDFFYPCKFFPLSFLWKKNFYFERLFYKTKFAVANVSLQHKRV